MSSQTDGFGNWVPISSDASGLQYPTSIIIWLSGSGNPISDGTIAAPGSGYLDTVSLALWYTANGTTWVELPSGGGGGGGSGQIVAYTSGTPAAPANPGLPAVAYDPNGILPTFGWNVNTQSWH